MTTKYKFKKNSIVRCPACHYRITEPEQSNTCKCGETFHKKCFCDCSQGRTQQVNLFKQVKLKKMVPSWKLAEKKEPLIPYNYTQYIPPRDNRIYAGHHDICDYCKYTIGYNEEIYQIKRTWKYLRYHMPCYRKVKDKVDRGERPEKPRFLSSFEAKFDCLLICVFLGSVLLTLLNVL